MIVYYINFKLLKSQVYLLFMLFIVIHCNTFEESFSQSERLLAWHVNIIIQFKLILVMNKSHILEI